MNQAQLDQILAAQNLPNVSAVITNATENLYEGAAGHTVAADGKQVTVDTSFAIMSMTKPITSLAIMRLVEQGDIQLDAPAADYLAQYVDHPVLDCVDLAAGTWQTRPAKAAFTIRQLLNHTAGFGYVFCNETLEAFKPESNSETFPLCHEPGNEWTYGLSTRILGQILESVTGKDLEAVLVALVLEPLGMTATTFAVNTDQAQVHTLNENQWQAIPLGPAMPMGDGGLISTAVDYSKFLRCLLNQGAPLLTSKTFDQMITNQIGDLFIREMPAANPGLTYPFPRGVGIDKWGLGFQLHQQDKTGGRHAGSYSWCGLYNTYFWVDPVAGLGAIMLTQVLPLYEPLCLQALDAFEQAVYQT